MAVSMQEIVQVSVWRAVQVSVLRVVSSLVFGGSTVHSFSQSVFYLSTTLIHKYTALSLTSYSPVVRSAEESEGDGKYSSMTKEY